MKQKKRIVRLAVGHLCYGIAWGCTCLVFICLIYWAFGYMEVLEQIFQNFGKHAAGSVLVGIACCSSSMIYRFDRIPFLAKLGVHFVVGMGVLYSVSFYLGWIPFYPDRPWYMVRQFLGTCMIFAVIWCCFYFFNRSEAKKINHRLRELEARERLER